MTSSHRETVWLGSSEHHGIEDDTADYDIGTEDDMVSISCIRQDGSELEAFICRNLFDQIRAMMDTVERRQGRQRQKQDEWPGMQEPQARVI